MKSDKLQDAIGEVKDEYIADAHPEAAAPQKENRRIVWVAAGACVRTGHLRIGWRKERRREREAGLRDA